MSNQNLPLKKNYISGEGFLKLQREFEDLFGKQRPELLKVIQWAVSNGDRSENADYIYGKRRLREIDRRLKFLKSRLDGALIVDFLSFKNLDPLEIRFGATVVLTNELGTIKSVVIVGVDEVDIKRHFYSWDSPLGRSLIGKKLGEEVIVRSPSGEYTYEIESIDYIAWTEPYESDEFIK